MKTRILTIILSILAAGLLSVSCSEKYFDFEQHGVLPVDKTYAEANDAEALSFLAAVYSDVRNLMMGDWGVHFIATSTVKVADSWPGGERPSDGPDYQLMARFTDNSETGAYKDMFQRFYKIIYKSNMIVSKLNGGSAERQRVIAEAKAWRAWAMMHLTQLWGSAPLVDYVVGDKNYNPFPGNTDPAVSWKWIMQQFEEAAAVLPSKAGLGGQKAIGGRWTKEACYAYKGKGYMWQNDYENAKIELAKVINSKKYELWHGTATMGPSNYGVNTLLYKKTHLDKGNGNTWIDGSEDYKYSTVFRAAADFCDEFLLELDIDGDATTIGNTEPYWFRAYMNWRWDQINPPANSTKNDGWGFIIPTKTFGQAFCKHDGNSLRRRANIATFDEVYRMFPYGLSVKEEDTDGDGNPDTQKEVGQGILGQSFFSCEGYTRMKYYDFLDDVEQTHYASGQGNGNLTNYPLMRYSNVLLLYAEACCLSGEGTADISGLEALNIVRRRAGLSDAPSLDMDDEMYGIKAERRFELYLEDCDRYVDLIRWGDYGDFIMDKSKVGDFWGTHCPYFYGFIDTDKVTEDPSDLSNYKVEYVEQSQRGQFSNKFLLWPFPYEEIKQNSSLIQNTGW